MVADAHLVQTHSLLAGAFRPGGGALLDGPGRKVVEAYQRETALPDDEDPPSVDVPTDPATPAATHERRHTSDYIVVGAGTAGCLLPTGSAPTQTQACAAG
jgi:hypothetical protein